MSEKMKNIPKLRFPEFLNDEDWKEKNLDEISEIITGKTPSTQDVSLWNGNIDFITPTDIQENNKYQLKTERKVKNINYKILPQGTIVYTCIASIGKIAITINPSITNQQINSIIVNIKYNNEFIYYSLLVMTPYIKSLQGNNTLPIINKTEFSKFKIKLPKLVKEQQKIADCLSSIDSLISVQSQKVESLKKYKNGLLQNFFPKNGENIPKLRFPEFENDGEWEEKFLKELCRITNGKSNVQDHDKDGVYPLFDRSEVIKKSNSYLFDCESVIIPGEGVRFIPKYYNGKFDLHQRAYALKDFKVNGKFIYYLMDFFKDILASQAVLSTVLSLRLPILENFTIKIPKQKEQDKIVNFLTSIDEEINLQIQKVESLKKHKKALLQQLFPNNEGNK